MYFFLFHLIFYSPNIQSSILNGDCTNLKSNSVFTVHWMYTVLYAALNFRSPGCWMFNIMLFHFSHLNLILMLDGRKWEDEMLIWMKYSLLLFAYVFFTLRNTNSFSQTFYSKRMMRWMWWCTCIRIWRSFGSLDSSSE